MSKKVIVPDYNNYNYYVTIKCKKCKSKPTGFYPHRVIHLRPCKCGNTNYGECLKDWPQRNYGDFYFIKEEVLILTTPLQREMQKLEKDLGSRLPHLPYF